MTTTDTRGDATVRTAVRLHRAIEEATGVSLPLRLWDGSEVGDAEPPFRLELVHPWSARAAMLPPTDLAFGEAYVRGDIDLHGDLFAAVAAADGLGSSLGAADKMRIGRLLLQLPRPPRRPSPARARLRGRRHDLERSRAAIAFHYDHPAAFYASFLDDNLVYSCAYFTDDDDDLGRAQRRKLELVCRKLRLRPGMRLLDIGCGFGSLLIHAARHHGVQGLGVTLSVTQAEEAVDRVARAGVGALVEIRLQDYRTLEGSFDAVASIGMVEHVGPENLAAYAREAHRLTKPGGLSLTHSIVTGQHGRIRRSTERDFTSTHVFPDGGLAPAWRLIEAIQAGGFELLDVEQLRPHYARTLRSWVTRLERNREQAVAAAGEQQYRIWRLYMAAAAHGFASRHLGVLQVLGSKDADVPLGRRWMLPDPA